MRVLGDASRFCLCSGGAKSERLKGAIFSSKAAAFVTISTPNAAATTGGTGFLIHRNLLLTTHVNLPSVAAAEAAEIRICHGRFAAKLEPQRFFITSLVLDLTIVGLDLVHNDSAAQVQQPCCLKPCCNPLLELGSEVYLLGQADERDLMVGEGKVAIATDNLLKLAADGVTWSSGSAGFDAQGNLAFMVCNPMKLASSPTAKSSTSSPSSLSLKKDNPMQFGIPMPIIIDWLHQHWEGSLDEVCKPKLPLTKLKSTKQRGDNSCASFTYCRAFKSADDENDDDIASLSNTVVQQAKDQARASSVNENNVDLRSSHEQGIPTPEIFVSPKLITASARKTGIASAQPLDMNLPPNSRKTIFLPLPLKKMLSDENALGPGPGKQTTEYYNPSQEPSQAKYVRGHKVLPPLGTWQDDHCSEVESSSSHNGVLQNEDDRLSSERETMYSAETMESRNIPSPRDCKLHQVGRSKSCGNYSRWSSSPRNSSGPRASLQKQPTLIPVRKSSSQTALFPQKSREFCSPTLSSSMKKRPNTREQPMKPRQTAVQVSPKWMF